MGEVKRNAEVTPISPLRPYARSLHHVTASIMGNVGS